MPLYSVLNLLLLFFSLLLPILIISGREWSRLKGYIFYFCIILVIRCLAYVVISSTQDQELANFWYKFTRFASLQFSPIAVCFLIDFFNIRVKGASYPLFLMAILPGIFQIIRTFFFQEYNFNLIVTPNGSMLNTSSDIFHIIHSINYMIVIMAIIIFKIKEGVKKLSLKTSFVLIFLSLSSFFSAFLKFYYLPMVGLPKYLGFMPFYFVFLVGMYFIVIRYRLLNTTPSFSIDKIWDNLHSEMVLLDNNNHISSANSSFKEFFSNCIGSNIADLFHERDSIIDKVKLLNKEPKLDAIVSLNNSGSITSLRLQALYDKYDDRIGTLIIFNKILHYEDIKRKFELTPKEWEISIKLLQGLEYADIGQELKISFHTVKNHTQNVYKKLLIKNRNEIFSKLNV